MPVLSDKLLEREVVLFSDSKYVVDGITKGWANRWRANGWMRNKKHRAENSDLWAQLLELCEKYAVDFRWVKGHAGDPNNERCDQLATQAAEGSGLSIDEFYEHDSDFDPNAVPKIEKPLPEERREGAKVKIQSEGQPCRKCSTPVVKRRPKRKHKPGQRYYYEYYFYCPQCQAMYMVEEAKRPVDELRLL